MSAGVNSDAIEPKLANVFLDPVDEVISDKRHSLIQVGERI